jgi:phosphomannomutase
MGTLTINNSGESCKQHPCSSKINYLVNKVQQTIERILQHFVNPSPTGRGDGVREVVPIINHTDGVSIEFPDWRFNLRGSNTEPLLRLNVETRGNSEALNAHIHQLATLIGAAQ